MNVKVFLITVLVAAALAVIILFVAVDLKGSKVTPKPTQTTGPSSQLSQPKLQKPSPLHPKITRVAVRMAPSS
jgi:hypothetical protein